ncbi:flagellar basal body P-ring protein FlgI [Paraneptunicella aestuarii]|uniref:flagellar basal body P-ring protein FlgI n=1 Tax=Paraneptunicella aestuarii TaxID=2831148 RepID=UPI001E584A71|nr:flagellar basal body P-ring protein FlgI [Paraneptunicella aestuarii]UAA37596.1 flagellar basal body P-ring protein FlgI [Paraneptunicella aestuarii]
MNKQHILALLLLFLALPSMASSGVRLKELARIEGVQDNPLIGYGLVVGLSGSGDSSNNKATMQSLRNTLQSFAVNVAQDDIRSRNVAAVMVTATLPAFAQEGDKLEVNVSSIGDAKSLQGGTLLLTPLKAANDEIYALAQGPLSVGGYQFDYNGNSVRKNHPTVGVVPNGAKVEKAIEYDFSIDHGLTLVLNKPDFTTAQRIIESLQRHFPAAKVYSNHPAKVQVKFTQEAGLLGVMAEIESLQVEPDKYARVVVNERNGTVVAGAEVKIDDVVISHGALKLNIKTTYSASQPAGYFRETPDSIESMVIANSDMSVEETSGGNVRTFNGASIGELVEALKALNLSTRDLIAVLQAIEKAGALHAELIIQ